MNFFIIDFTSIFLGEHMLSEMDYMFDLWNLLFTIIFILLLPYIFNFILGLIWGIGLFKKMGENPWLSFIPFYKTWVWCKHTMGSGEWMFSLFTPALSYLLYPVLYYKTYKACGKGDLFAVLGIFLPFICLSICALDKSEFKDQVVGFGPLIKTKK